MREDLKMNPEETDLIVKYSLSNEETLTLAIKVALAYPALRRRIFSDFLCHLQEKVQEALGSDWLTVVEIDAWVGISARRRKWPETISLGVRSDGVAGRYVYLWVKRFNALLREGQTDEMLKCELDEQVGKGGTTKEAAWWMSPSKHRDWGTEGALVELYNRQRAAEYLTNLIVRIAEVVDSVVGP
jgi:hypothetical protein